MKEMRTENIYLSNLPKALRPQAKELLKKHENLWSGHLGNIKEPKL